MTFIEAERKHHYSRSDTLCFPGGIMFNQHASREFFNAPAGTRLISIGTYLKGINGLAVNRHVVVDDFGELVVVS